MTLARNLSTLGQAATTSGNLPTANLTGSISTSNLTGTYSSITFNDSTVQVSSANTYALGIGQTWQSVVASRALGTTYYNTTSKPIVVIVGVNSSGSGAAVGVNVGGAGYTPGTFNYGGAAPSASASVIVPPGLSYVGAITGGSGSLISWYELR